jgi:hypothetical protein
VAVLLPEFLRRLLPAFANLAALNRHVVVVGDAINLKVVQSRFTRPMFFPAGPLAVGTDRFTGDAAAIADTASEARYGSADAEDSGNARTLRQDTGQTDAAGLVCSNMQVNRARRFNGQRAET